MEKSTKRLLGIAAIGCIAIGATVLFTQPELISNLPKDLQRNPVGVVAQAPKTNLTGKPVMPEGSGVPGQVMRDLFAPPSGYAALLAQPVADPSARNGGKPSSTGPLPVLTGVIQGDGTRVAILRQGTISRSYRVGQEAGAYTVASIGGNSVTLTGPSGTTVLTIGQ